jgi:hypothetical protein
LFFSCCGSIAAHFKHAATSQPRRNPTAETCVDNTAKLRPQASVLVLRAAGASQQLKSNARNEEKREAGGQGKFSVGLAARRDVASQPATLR